MRFFNTLTRRIDAFAPQEEDHVRMYTCGPTVYDYAHIGNFRAYVFEDLLRRALQYRGYRVTQVMNLTDVDDKTIRSSREHGVALNDYTRRFKDAFFEDLQRLNIESAEHYPEATRHIPEMIALIERLFENGYAYQSEDGSVYFSLEKFKAYGRLARIDKSGMKAGARVAQDEYDKDDVADFALWKAWSEEDGDVVWDSPWGRGRPGWHIECSAMSMKYLGETFDIHTGGIDNMFPHHDDEIAQSEGATGKPFVRFWLHCGYLMVEGKKMAKSQGNFYTLRQVLDKGYSGREVRYLLASAHYRQSMNFTFEALDGARRALARLDEFRERVSAAVDADNAQEAGAADGGELPEWAARAQSRFGEALDNDLSIPEALAALFDMVREGHRAMDEGNGEVPGTAVCALWDRFDAALGFLQSGREETDAEALSLCRERDAAREEKNWARADEIRDRLAEMGWEVRDSAEGSKLKRIRA